MHNKKDENVQKREQWYQLKKCDSKPVYQQRREKLREQEIQKNIRQKKHRPDRIKNLIDEQVEKMERTGEKMSVRAVQEIKDWLDHAANPKADIVVEGSNQEVCSVRVLNNLTRPKEKRPRLTGVLFQGLEPIEVDPIVDPPQRSCFNCWERGHKSRTCPKPPTLDEYCKNCGRRGTLIFSCPRCARAFRVVKWLQSLSKYYQNFAKPRKVEIWDEENWDEDNEQILHEENWDEEEEYTHYEDSYDGQAAFSSWDEEEEQALFEEKSNGVLDAGNRAGPQSKMDENNNETCSKSARKRVASALDKFTRQSKNSLNIRSSVERNNDPDGFVRRITILTEQVERLNAYTATLPQDLRNDVFRYIFEVPKSF